MSFLYLQTDRFLIRQWKLDDASDLWQIMSDGRVHSYTGDSAWTKARAKNYIQLMLNKDFRTLEVFHLACILKSNNTLIGFTGLNPYLPKQPELEWQFGVPYWGHGYATEIGKAVIEAAFSSTDIRAIYGMVNLQNKASLQVMEKIGMTSGSVGMLIRIISGVNNPYFRVKRPTSLGLQEFRGELDMMYKINRDIHLMQSQPEEKGF